MAVPTLALIPAAQGSKFYSVLPTDGVGDFDFSRASTATRVNSKGLIEEVASGVSRLDYTGGGCPHHLLEPQSKNLLTYSEAFDNAYWTKSGSSVTSGFISPTGALGAFKLVEDTSNGQHATWTTSAVTVTANTDVTFTAYVKKIDRRYIAVGVAHSSSRGAIAQFDLDTQSLVYSGGIGTIYTYVSSDIKSLGNYWYRLEFVCQTTLTSIQPSIALSDDIFTNPSILNSANFYTGNGTSGVYIFGAQVEQKSYATSYIPNFGTALGVTRLAETATGSGDADTFNDSEGVLFAEISALADDLTNRTIGILADSSNFIELAYRNDTNQIRILIKSSNVVVVNLQYSLPDVTLYNKIVVKYKSNDCSLWVNGFEVLTDTSASMPSGLSQLNFNRFDGAEDFYGKTKQLQYYNTALTALETETLTSYTSFNEMALNFNYTI